MFLHPKPNITRGEIKAHKKFKQKKYGHPHSRKGVALVVLYKQNYIKKAENLLEQGGTTEPSPNDPTSRQENKLINLLKRVKTEGGISDSTCRRRYLIRSWFSKFLRASQNTSERHSPPAIVSSRGHNSIWSTQRACLDSMTI